MNLPMGSPVFFHVGVFKTGHGKVPHLVFRENPSGKDTRKICAELKSLVRRFRGKTIVLNFINVRWINLDLIMCLVDISKTKTLVFNRVNKNIRYILREWFSENLFFIR